MAPQSNTLGRTVLDWVLAFAIACIVLVFLRMFVIEAYRVPTGSMESTIEVGDMLIGQKVSINLGMGVQPGDVVVFKNPDSSSQHDVLVKRVIATAGQTVDLRGGSVYVDGRLLDENYTQGGSYPLASQAPGVEVSFPYKVPDGCVWVMGDNRENSSDSRYFGAVPEEDLVSVILFRYWPLDRLGPLGVN